MRTRVRLGGRGGGESGRGQNEKARESGRWWFQLRRDHRHHWQALTFCAALAPPPLQQASGGEAKQNGEVSARWEGEGGGRARPRTTSPFSATRKQLLLNVPQEEEQETKGPTKNLVHRLPHPSPLFGLLVLFFFSFFPKIMEVPLLKVKRYARRPLCNSLLITFHSQEVLSRDWLLVNNEQMDPQTTPPQCFSWIPPLRVDPST